MSSADESVRQRIRQLSPEQRAALERKLLDRQAAEGHSSGGRSLPLRPPGAPLVLSFPQQQLWFLDQWQPGSSAYNASLNLRFEGVLDGDALLAAFNTIVQRHETLHTVVKDDGGVPVAELLVDPTVRFDEIDLRHLSSEAAEEAIAEAVKSIVERPFDLSSDVMLRVGLVRINEHSNVICMVLHHIACDGWSRGILFDELTQLYNAYAEGRPSPLESLAVQYSDYAAWQLEWLRGEVLAREIAFWRTEIGGADLVLELPTDHTRPDVLDFRGERIRFEVGPARSSALRALGREERATLYMVVHALTGVFLHGLTRQENFLVGSPMGNRRFPETESLIGFFVNTVIFPVNLEGMPSFRELLRRSRATAISCYAHQEVPFDRLVQALGPKRRSDRNPLFQVNLRVQGGTPPAPALKGLVGNRINVGLGSSRFDLALGFIDEPGQIGAYIEYNEALFAEATVLEWCKGFLEMIDAIVSDPDRQLSELVAPFAKPFT